MEDKAKNFFHYIQKVAKDMYDVSTELESITDDAMDFTTVVGNMKVGNVEIELTPFLVSRISVSFARELEEKMNMASKMCKILDGFVTEKGNDFDLDKINIKNKSGFVVMSTDDTIN